MIAHLIGVCTGMIAHLIGVCTYRITHLCCVYCLRRRNAAPASIERHQNSERDLRRAAAAKQRGVDERAGHRAESARQDQDVAREAPVVLYRLPQPEVEVTSLANGTSLIDFLQRKCCTTSIFDVGFSVHECFSMRSAMQLQSDHVTSSCFWLRTTERELGRKRQAGERACVVRAAELYAGAVGRDKA